MAWHNLRLFLVVKGEATINGHLNTDLIENNIIHSGCIRLYASKAYRSGASRKKIVLGLLNRNADYLYRLFEDGTVDAPGATQHARSVATSDTSIFIGSARLSYDRNSHALTLTRLKTNHVPIYLANRGIVENDLSKAINSMTVIDWVEQGRTTFTDEHLTLHDVFPDANADWDIIDAPVPSLTTWQTGADADITTLEGEVDQLQIDVTALQQGGGATSVTTHTDVTSAGSGAIITAAERTSLTGLATHSHSAFANAVTFSGDVSLNADLIVDSGNGHT